MTELPAEAAVDARLDLPASAIRAEANAVRELEAELADMRAQRDRVAAATAHAIADEIRADAETATGPIYRAGMQHAADLAHRHTHRPPT